jgi:hypothetical protein
MRVPDRPLAETDADDGDGRPAGPDYRARSEGLAERLNRLLAGHPSADWAAHPDRSYLNPDDTDADDAGLDDWDAADDMSADYLSPGDLSPCDADHDEVAPDDLESREVALGDGPGSGPRLHSSPDPPNWDGLFGEHHGPYRPWFSADRASDPWFAEPTDGAGE